MFYLDNDQDLVNNGIPIRSLYDANDVLGIHVSSKGADVLADTMLTFLFSGLDTEAASDETPSRKRNRSVLSNTPPLAEKRFPKSNKF